MTRWSDIATTYVMAYLNGEWVNITSYVLMADGIQGSVGRSTELSQIDPSTLTFVLRNQDGRFTPDNTSGAYYPYWTSGVPIRWSETIGPYTYRFPDMYLEIGEVALTFEADGAPTQSDRVFRVNCIDKLTRVNRAPRFISTLGAHIVSSVRNSALRAYYPLGDPVDRQADVIGSLPPVVAHANGNMPAFGTVTGEAAFTAQGGESIPGDDLVPGLLEFSSYEFGGDTYAKESIDRGAEYLSTDLPLAAGEVMTIVAWVRSDWSATVVDSVPVDVGAVGNVASGSASIVVLDNVWVADVDTQMGGLIEGPCARAGYYQLVALRYGYDPDVFELWVDDRAAYTGTLTGTTPTSMYMSGLDVPAASFAGSVAHLQIYIGADDDFTNDDFLAQYEIGINGFANQTVDERIRTICNYAGITDGELSLESSDSLMPVAAFAEQRPGTLASAAAVTGGGILFTRESEIVYHDRKHRFNL